MIICSGANRGAWATAKNRALDILRCERTARPFTPELGRMLDSEWTLAPTVEELFGESAIHDGQLRMMSSCCHSRLPEEAQVALMLHILCGFSVDELAGAFVSSHAAIVKHISRAKKVLAGSKMLFDVSGQSGLSARVPAVQRALDLLFNEGYHGALNQRQNCARIGNRAHATFSQMPRATSRMRRSGLSPKGLIPREETCPSHSLSNVLRTEVEVMERGGIT